MIIVVKPDVTKAELAFLENWLLDKNLKIKHMDEGDLSVLGVSGDTSMVDPDEIRAMSMVESVTRIREPYEKVRRKNHPNDTIVTAGNAKFGGGFFSVIAGPCSVETKEQITDVANKVKKCGAGVLRGGAFKPRTSPYDFQGLGEDGLVLLKEARSISNLPIVSEIMDVAQIPLFEDVDMIQVGARNMQNFQLLKELGKTNKPILLKRGLSSTIHEFLMSAEYIMAGGNEQVILCERGIRTFETSTRNTLDISAIPVLKEKTHLPVIVDPSHATGYSKYVSSMALAATAAGADGLMIEVHNDPSHAKCDGQQSITPGEFAQLMEEITAIRGALVK